MNAEINYIYGQSLSNHDNMKLGTQSREHEWQIQWKCRFLPVICKAHVSKFSREVAKLHISWLMRSFFPPSSVMHRMKWNGCSDNRNHRFTLINIMDIRSRNVVVTMVTSKSAKCSAPKCEGTVSQMRHCAEAQCSKCKWLSELDKKNKLLVQECL